MRCVKWTDLQQISNIAAYQRVIIVSSSLARLITTLKEEYEANPESDEAKAVKHLAKQLGRDLELLKNKLAQVLRAGGEVLAILTSPAYFSVPGEYVSVSVDEWLPLPMSLRHEPWEAVTVDEKLVENFAGYFSVVGKGEYVLNTRYYTQALDYLVNDELEPKPEARLTMATIATDWQQFPVACSLHFTLHDPVKTNWGGTGHEEEPSLVSGPLILLPAPPNTLEDLALDRILVDRYGLAAATPDPDWFDDIVLPEEAASKARLVDALKNLQAAEDTVAEIRADLDSIVRFKRVVSEKGMPLQVAVRGLFEGIGISTEDSPISDEFVLLAPDPILVEVTGSDGSIATRDLSQLIKDLGKYLEATETPAKGLLIVNPWRLTPLNERDTKDRPTFPDDVKKTAATFSIALISTTVLLHAYECIITDAASKEQLVKILLSTVGEVQFDSIDSPSLR